ncbi:MAG: hypothetical protein HKO65_12645 [Gemmatimonadetes bacterium]|nr:hypothetical protein [Gemmatimonadota bacterium]NNM05930.1 hypothetical protein [Gemmatimonadota bacterium]
MTKIPSDKNPLEIWLRERVPEIPAPFLPFLLEGVGDGLGLEALASEGEAALNRAVQESGKGREAAFHLLAADAFLTYACEVAAEESGEEDLPGQLKVLLARLGERFS